MHGSGASHCRTCGADVYWLKNERTGKMAPVDAPGDPKGNIAANLAAGTYRIVSAGERETHIGPLHTSHFVTCPEARSWAATSRRA